MELKFELVTFEWVDTTAIGSKTNKHIVISEVCDLFQVLVSEKDDPTPKTSTTELTVKVLDVNDNEPSFPPAGYSVNVKEGSGRREVVKVIVRPVSHV